MVICVISLVCEGLVPYSWLNGLLFNIDAIGVTLLGTKKAQTDTDIGTEYEPHLTS